jgi:hypothetical protein
VQFLGLFSSEMQECVWATRLTDGHLQLLIQDSIDQTEKPDEIGLTRPVRANQYIEAP